MIIYRVQDRDGRGPWKNGIPERWLDDRDRSHLAPDLQLLNRIIGQATPGMAVGFGCRKLKLLRLWFTHVEYTRLQLLGYHAVMLQVARILGESKTECAFERPLPLRVGIVPVELYPSVLPA